MQRGGRPGCCRHCRHRRGPTARQLMNAAVRVVPVRPSWTRTRGGETRGAARCVVPWWLPPAGAGRRADRVSCGVTWCSGSRASRRRGRAGRAGRKGWRAWVLLEISAWSERSAMVLRASTGRAPAVAEFGSPCRRAGRRGGEARCRAHGERSNSPVGNAGSPLPGGLSPRGDRLEIRREDPAPSMLFRLIRKGGDARTRGYAGFAGWVARGVTHPGVPGHGGSLWGRRPKG